MNKLITIAVIFCCLQVIQTAATKNVWQTLMNKFERQFNNECHVPGLTCKNCETLMFCVEKEPGVFEENIIQTCNSEQTCLLDHCAVEPNPNCPIKGATFVCTGTGIFPDPYDCTNYHVCIQKSSIVADDDVPVDDLYATVKCPENWGYNAVTTYCDKPLANGFCPTEPPVPDCTEVGDFGKIEDTSIYYICTIDSKGKLLAVLHMCPHGTVIDENGVCN